MVENKDYLFFLEGTNSVDPVKPLPCINIARLQGFVASEQGFSIHQNPYPYWTLQHAWWEAGHSDATDELCGRHLME